MHQIRRVLRIPKDPRTDDTVFLTEIPVDLLDRITQEEWEAHIGGLNCVIAKKDAWSIWSMIKTLLIIPAAIHLTTYDEDVRKYLKDVNEALRSKRIYIEDPSLTSYSELEIVLIDDEVSSL